MERNKAYYENWLNYIEFAQLEAVGSLLRVEMLMYETRKIIRKALELNEYNNSALDRIKTRLIDLKGKRRILAEEIDNHELDIAHCQFMIDLLNRPPHEDG